MAEIVQINQDNAEQFLRYLPGQDREFLTTKGLLGYGLTGKGNAVGLLLASVRPHMRNATIESFYIEPEYRGQGYGSSMLATLKDALRSIKIAFLDAQIGMPQDVVAKSYLIHWGFIHESELYRINHIIGASLKAYIKAEEALGEKGQLGYTKKYCKGRILSLAEADSKVLAQLEKGLVADYAEADFVGWKTTDQDLSRVLLDETQNPKAVVCISHVDGVYDLSWMNAASDVKMESVYLVYRTLCAIAEQIDDGEMFTLTTVTPGSARLLEIARKDAPEEFICEQTTVQSLLCYISAEDTRAFMYEEM